MLKKEKFQKLALRRVDRTLGDLELIANLTTSRYNFTQEQAVAITSELKKKVNYIEGLFERRISLNEKKEKKDADYTHDSQ
ncbi:MULTISPECIES: hypothetical protein [Bacillaceae]|uniref:hypothetical protein n=1 Tax=Bacillaceae TaxID=186817 RepID=UPI001A8F98F8|nr:hypothetical protein [Bacillus sp. FW1]GFM12044.1 uncharacterized protein FW1_contig-01-38 [Bacillus sp. FW1]